MIVVDTSALMALILNEPEANRIATAIESGPLLMSAGTIAEALIVATGRSLIDEMTALIEGLGVETVSITAAGAREVAQAYALWGKGRHPAALNFGDCFAYQLANERDLPLLFVGDDFARTNIISALA